MLLGTVETLPVEIRIVKNCGDWEHEGHRGYYRLVVGDVYGGVGSEAYVQWFEYPEQIQVNGVYQWPVLRTTLKFTELNDDHSRYFFDTAECRKKGRFTYVHLKGSYEHDENNEVHDISIKLIDVGKYELVHKVGKPARRARRP